MYHSFSPTILHKSHSLSYSNIISFTTPCNYPNIIFAEEIDDETLRLHFEDVTGADEFILQYKKSTSSSYSTINNISGNAEYIDVALERGYTYDFQIIALSQSTYIYGDVFTREFLVRDKLYGFASQDDNGDLYYIIEKYFTEEDNNIIGICTRRLGATAGNLSFTHGKHRTGTNTNITAQVIGYTGNYLSAIDGIICISSHRNVTAITRGIAIGNAATILHQCSFFSDGN